MIGKLAKKLSQAFSPKKVTKVTRKVIPKVATGGLLIGAGIGADKLMNGMEDQPAIMASAPEDSNLIDRSYSFIKVEDLLNGQSEALMGPARISTIIMIVLLLIGMMYPCYILYKRVFSCLTKQRQTRWNQLPSRNSQGSAESTPWWPREIRRGRLRMTTDCRVLTAIVDHEVKFERETDTVSRYERIKELEQEIRALNTSRMNV